MSNLQQQRLVVEQLRREVEIKRISVRQAINDIMKYVYDHQQEDYLMIGFSSQKANPFREKSSCSVLWSQPHRRLLLNIICFLSPEPHFLLFFSWCFYTDIPMIPQINQHTLRARLRPISRPKQYKKWNWRLWLPSFDSVNKQPA